MIRRLLAAAAAVFVWAAPPAQAESDTCHGEFPNLINGVCWSCTFPIKMFGSTSLVSMGQEDFDSYHGDPFCYCPGGTKVGTPVSFWEPARMVDVTRTPYCFPLLGGIKIDAGVNDMAYGAISSDQVAGIGTTRSSFRQVNYYLNPIMYVLDVMLDNSCIENKGIDVAYISALDPTHNDEELAGILAPYAFPFGGSAALGACAADCVTATAGFPRSELFWCAGCNGTLYPLTGTANAHISLEQVGRLHAQRILAKFHAAGTQWATFGNDAMCGYYPKIIMDKRAYKLSRLYYRPQTTKINGKCCDPLGRTTIHNSPGAEVPIVGEDIGYLLFRKRDCCQGVLGAD